MLNTQDKAQILALQRQIDAIVQVAKKRPSGLVCHICGAGDKLTKNGITFKVKGIVNRYEHRPEQSPHLCHNHNGGWSLTVDSFDPLGRRSAEEIDLHYASYVAKQLLKESKK